MSPLPLEGVPTEWAADAEADALVYLVKRLYFYGVIDAAAFHSRLLQLGWPRPERTAEAARLDVERRRLHPDINPCIDQDRAAE